MLSKIKLHKTACYNDIVEFEPKEINYFFGSNGVGKSSLGKVISNVSSYPSCEINWASSPVDIKIYNKQFVKDSFSQSNKIKGIYTIGKDLTDTQTYIEETNKKIGDHKTKIDDLEKSQTQQVDRLSNKLTETREKASSIKR